MKFLAAMIIISFVLLPRVYASAEGYKKASKYMVAFDDERPRTHKKHPKRKVASLPKKKKKKHRHHVP